MSIDHPPSSSPNKAAGVILSQLAASLWPGAAPVILNSRRLRGLAYWRRQRQGGRAPVSLPSWDNKEWRQLVLPMANLSTARVGFPDPVVGFVLRRVESPHLADKVAIIAHCCRCPVNYCSCPGFCLNDDVTIGGTLVSDNVSIFGQKLRREDPGRVVYQPWHSFAKG